MDIRPALLDRVEGLPQLGTIRIPSDPRVYGLLGLPQLRRIDFPQAPLVIVDTETTGVLRDSVVVDLAAVFIDDKGDPVRTFSTLVEYPTRFDPPMGPREIEALAVSGIDRWQLREAPSRAAAWQSFVDWSVPVPRNTRVTSFGRPFDQRLIGQTFPPAGVETLDPWWTTCLMQGLRDAHPTGQKRFTLERLARRFGVLPGDATQPHRALPDCLIAWGCWRMVWELIGRPVRGDGTSDLPDDGYEEPLDPDVPF